MKRTFWIAVGALIGGLAVALTGPALSQNPAPAPSLGKTIAEGTQLKEEQVDKVLSAFGPEVSKLIASGREVNVKGLGSFRIVRIAASRNLVEGRVVVEDARNVVEFIPEASLDQAANARGVVPNAEVPSFQYIPFPGQTPGQKVPNTRTPSSRIR